MKDEFDAIERWYRQKFPIEFATGRVVTVDFKDVLILVNDSNTPQRCDYPNVLTLSPGDECVLTRNRRENSRWVVLTNFCPRGKVSNYDTINGNSRTSPYSYVGVGTSTTSTVNTTTWVEIASVLYTFHGGTPLITYNANAEIASSSSNLYVGVIIGDTGARTQVFQTHVATTYHPNSAINFTHMGAEKLYGQYKIRIVAACATASRSFTISHYSLQVAEI